MSSELQALLDEPKRFTKESIQFINRCTKPDRKGTNVFIFNPKCVEFVKIAQAVGVGFLMMGIIGYTVKLVHIPINNIIVY